MRSNQAFGRRTLQFSIAIATLLVCSSFAQAGTWQGIEPLVSRRADVLKALGTPLSDPFGGPLTFKILGGTASVSFVDENFVRAKKLRPEFAGTVLQIILQHERSSDTPESMGLGKNRNFTREESKGALIFRNLKEGIVYTFIEGRLRTTRYTFSDNQLAKVRR